MERINPLSASEIGTLWLTFQEKTMILRILEYFMVKSDDQEAKNIMGGLWQELHFYVIEIKSIFEKEGMVIPLGFRKEDVNMEAPKLYDNGFDIMFLRILKELSMGLYTININMAYRKDVIAIYEGLTAVTQKIYKLSTIYLLNKGILTLPPNMTMPKTVEFVKSDRYMKGFKPFGDKRSLSGLEVGILHHGIETNNVGMQLITGFAQCAENKKVRKYFVKGLELAKKQIQTIEEILLEANVHFSTTSGSIVTTSTVAPFSDKMMLYCICLFNGFGLVGGSFGAMFTLRNDISMKMSLLSKDVFLYGQEGLELMMNNGWFEEPPQMEDRPRIMNR
ncbi:DUF3231 family protein [Neobacillus vireti]|uniref:DUF3231 family protein n=1 Tax=Neobacillus vireti TaxID=220686 RepID=UPI002FFF9742